MKVLIAYYSKTGNTKQMAEAIAESIKKENLEVILKKVEEVNAKDLLDYQGLIFGTPTYYGTCSYQIKRLLDGSVILHGKLDGKAGGAFTSSNNIGGGNETAILSILEAMLIHGMIIQGDSEGDHYGPVAIGGLDKRAKENCQRFAKRFADLVKKISG